MFKVCYNVENYWGIEREEMDEKFQNLEDGKKFCYEVFNEYDEWWIEDEEGNEVWYCED